MTDPFTWFKDQVRLLQRDQRVKKASGERLERAGTEPPTPKKLADIDDTDDEPGLRIGAVKGNHQEGMSAELTILIARAGQGFDRDKGRVLILSTPPNLPCPS
jgi:hypothetical protein